MNAEEARRFASQPFSETYTDTTPDVLERYIDFCRTVGPGGWLATRYIRDLELYERAERVDFDSWMASRWSCTLLAQYATKLGRCDIIEKYVHQSTSTDWNFYVAKSYQPRLYPILHLVMPLPVSTYNALVYVEHDLHREVAVHILGREDQYGNGKLITVESIAKYPLIGCSVRGYRNLEEIGLDLSDPSVLYAVLTRCWRDNAVVALLRERVSALDVTMPNGKTLREMLI